MIPNAVGTALEDENVARRILRAKPSAVGPDVDLDGLGDLGTILEGSEARSKGLESLGGLWRGLGTPRSQDFEDVSSRLLDPGGAGTGRTMAVTVIMLDFGSLRNQYLGP